MSFKMRTVPETAEEWGVSAAWVRRLCQLDRIPRAVKVNPRIWLIPANVEKPTLRRGRPPAKRRRRRTA